LDYREILKKDNFINEWFLFQEKNGLKIKLIKIL
jgi:hypothetical protein